MVRILNIAGKFWVHAPYMRGRPIDGDKFYKIFDNLEDASKFRSKLS